VATTLSQLISSVQFIYAFRPSTEYLIRNTGTGSDGRSCQRCFDFTQLQFHTSCPWTYQLLSRNTFWKFFERILFILRHLQSFVVAFIEQVQNIEKSQTSVLEVLSCFATVIQERQSDVGEDRSKQLWRPVDGATCK